MKALLGSFVVLSMPFLSVVLLTVQERQPPPPRGEFAQDDAQLEIRMRGPVHEGFAAPYAPERDQQFSTDQQPPPPIEELPAAIMPEEYEGYEPHWLPGYWGWDVDTGWVWVSGTWRIPPPEMHWVPGYWVATNRGTIWVPGFWHPDGTEVVYLPPPPEPREIGPDGPAPGPNHFWVPGCWIYQDTGYVWRSGFWSLARPDWVWVPCCYYWTPRGYVFVDGYWDYPPNWRGWLFAPVRLQPGWRGVYRPSVLLGLESLLVHLFVRPDYSHYYFGNYYGLAPTARGWHSWVDYGRRRELYDPLAMYYRSTNVNFWNQTVNRHTYFVRNADLRPPFRWNEYRQFVERRRNDLPEREWLARSLQDWVELKRDRGFRRLTDDQLRNWERIRSSYRDVIESRKRFEFGSKQIQMPKDVIRWQSPKAIAPKKGDQPPDNGKGKGQVIPPVQKGKQKIEPPGQTGKQKLEPPGQKGKQKIDPPGQKGKIVFPPDQKGKQKAEPPGQKGKIVFPPDQKGKQKIDPPGQKGKTVFPPEQKGKQKIEPPGQKGKKQVIPGGQLDKKLPEPPRRINPGKRIDPDSGRGKAKGDDDKGKGGGKGQGKGKGKGGVSGPRVLNRTLEPPNWRNRTRYPFVAMLASRELTAAEMRNRLLSTA